MDGLLKYQATQEALDSTDRHLSPRINPDELPTPVAILSVDDGVIVYANEAFRQIVVTTKVGEPIKGFLHTPELLHSIANKLKKSSPYIAMINRSKSTLRFTITLGEFLEAPHYFTCIEKINKEDEKKPQPYLNR